ncbi:MAG: MFS transporter [Chloroflexi bacterium]|nr:MFS transporter [Chloroflexota bacterium]
MENQASKKVVLLIATLSSFFTPFNGSSMNVALPSIGSELTMDAVLLAWLPTGYHLSAVILLVPFGRIADMYGRRRVFLTGAFVYTFTSLACALSTSAAMLLTARIVQGIGASMILGIGTALVTSAFSPLERGRALGVTVAATYIGLSVGPFIGGILTYYFGWRSVFLSVIPVGILMISLTFWKLKEERAQGDRGQFDFVGSAIYAVMVATFIYGFTTLPGTMAILLMTIGVLALIVFIKWESRTASPVLSLGLFRHNLAFAMANLAAMINYAATFAVGFLLSLYMQYIMGLSPRDAGIVLVTQPIVMAVLSPVAGRLSDKFEPRIVSSVGMAFTAAGLFMYALLDENTTLQYITAALITCGFGFALFSSPNTNAVMSSVDKKSYGIASAVVQTMRLTGQMFSMGTTMLTFALYLGRVPITPDNYPMFVASVKTIFTVFAAISVVAVFASLVRGKRADAGEPESRPS